MVQEMGMLRKSGLAAVLSLTAWSGFGASAEAQWTGYGPYARYSPPVVMEEMTPRELAQVVRAQGFGNPSRPVYHDEVAIITASTGDGRRVRLTIDAFSGQILGSAQVVGPRPAPRREQPQIVQRVPDQGSALRRSVPDSERRVRATPEKPTIVRREPMLPALPTPKAQPGSTGVKQAPTVGSPAGQMPLPQAQQATPPSVGTGTRAAPRRIDMVPPAELDSSQKSPLQSTTPPI